MEARSTLNITPSVEDLLRNLAPQVLGTLVRRSDDFDAAEDAVQEALLAAALHWPRDGVPAKPRAWLVQTAVRAGKMPGHEQKQVTIETQVDRPFSATEKQALKVTVARYGEFLEVPATLSRGSIG